MVAAVAAGAFAAAAAGSTLQSLGSDSDANVTPLASSRDASAAFGVGGDTKASAPELLPVALSSDASAEVQKLDDSASVTTARVEREEAEQRKKEEEAKRPKIVNPCPEARFTSGFGARWGASHNGIDLAAPIGTPILAAADGTVIEAGSASGFGLWVRIQMDDGTIHVYGHMNSFSVRSGQKVKAGEQIAEVGNRGQSTGPHLHFEVWTGGGKKIDPSPWLRERGVKI
ncbi:MULTISPECIES: M23 family metallopeptidase [unclassified Amycolatopsis]|uniref:M23 family metallopeptidase n=1 Tax=unclassified Amycolatopsis TaxID=2618356 RepID=UPI0012A7D69B|nr:MULTISPECIES: M23 family metallopeptidase [unclassified Amycolatopsis]QFU93861.1 Murein DD-endopeptidase MepM [Amycolatopsis sp. YIM 10]